VRLNPLLRLANVAPRYLCCPAGPLTVKLEIQVTDGNGVNTWFADIYVMKGNVE
jgi:hypothetical protein